MGVLGHIKTTKVKYTSICIDTQEYLIIIYLGQSGIPYVKMLEKICLLTLDSS